LSNKERAINPIPENSSTANKVLIPWVLAVETSERYLPQSLWTFALLKHSNNLVSQIVSQEKPQFLVKFSRD